MSGGIRRVLAALLAFALLASVASPALARENETQEEAASAPVTLDVLVMRPVGFVTLFTGIGLFVLSTPFVLVTRPMELGKPFETLVMRPVRFLWMDPLGSH
jgi:uncharacterized membrane protein YfcA